jgi:hypothetical protein
MRAIARHWAHADVARAMRTQCARCVLRLRQRLGDAAVDLGPAASAARLPERWLHGASGQLGPLQWWRLQRTPAVPVTVWQVRGSGVFTAHGCGRMMRPTCVTALSMRCTQPRSA